ncbi:MAG TPA: DUF3857 domain-containing protein [Terriglobales bacterium]|nr:DUF3857 domain-containing protein [Terriglobales bacterium]
MKRFPLRFLFTAFAGLLLLAFAVPSHAQNEDWIQITPQQMQVKEVPGDPGASAIQLYYADFIDDEGHNEFYHYAIKVLNEKGKKYADVEIEIPQEGSVSGLKARTIEPDGRIVEFSGKPFQKTVIKGKGIKILAKAFTMPEVGVGSIIEYKYRIDWPYISDDNFWIIQHDLYTVKEDFRMKPYSGDLEHFPRGYQVASVYANMPPGLKPQLKGRAYEMEAENMPAFQSEGYMPPEEVFKPQILFFYNGPGMDSADKFWEAAGKEWSHNVEQFIGNHKQVAEAAKQAIGNESDPEKKLRKLYARAQQIRNLSYERERTQQELKKEKLKDNQSVADVLEHGYGFRTEITRLFVALARAAGFSASIVRDSNRGQRFFDKGLLSRRQLDSEIAVVTVNGKDVYLDPATKFCPYGLLRWTRTSTTALKLDKKGGTFIEVPSAPYNKAVLLRVADLTLSPDGSAHGTVQVTFNETEALEHRLDALDSDEAGRKKSLEDEIEESLPSGASAKLTGSENWDDARKPLIANFHVEIPAYASAAGKRLLMPAFLFQTKQMSAFKHAERKYPVYFSYAFEEADKVSVKLPAGYSVEDVPPKQVASIGYAAYQNLIQFNGTQLVSQRVLQVNGIFFTLDRYPTVKDFFNKVQEGDEEQTILKEGTTSAQKGN